MSVENSVEVEFTSTALSVAITADTNPASTIPRTPQPGARFFKAKGNAVSNFSKGSARCRTKTQWYTTRPRKHVTSGRKKLMNEASTRPIIASQVDRAPSIR